MVPVTPALPVLVGVAVFKLAPPLLLGGAVVDAGVLVAVD